MSRTGSEGSTWNATRRHFARMTSALKYCSSAAKALRELGVATVGGGCHRQVAIANTDDDGAKAKGLNTSMFEGGGSSR